MMTQDALAARQREMEEQARAAEEGRRKNVALFERMWLTLGPDCIRAAGSQHQVEVAEALGIATSRWSRLLDQAHQVIREEAALASRPVERTDEALPDRTLEKRNADWQEQTKHMRAAHAELRKLAEKERRELESFTKGR
jgi:hypothetical protein